MMIFLILVPYGAFTVLMLVTSAAIRPFVRSLVERFRSQTTVLSQAEIHPRARLKTVGSV